MLVWLLLFVALLTAPDGAVARKKLLEAKYTHLRCSACVAMAHRIHQKLNSVPSGATFQSGHRRDLDDLDFDEIDDEIERKKFAGSELQAMEVLETLCDDMKQCSLRENPRSKVREFSLRREWRNADFYSTSDDEEVEGEEEDEVERLKFSACSSICHELFGEFEDKLVKAIRHNHDQDKETITEAICNTTTKICMDKRIPEHIELEKKRKQEFEERKAREKEKGFLWPFTWLKNHLSQGNNFRTFICTFIFLHVVWYRRLIKGIYEHGFRQGMMNYWGDRIDGIKQQPKRPTEMAQGPTTTRLKVL